MDKNEAKIQGVLIMDGKVLGSVVSSNMGEVLSSLLSGRGNLQNIPKPEGGRSMSCPNTECGEKMVVSNPHQCGDCPHCGTHVKPFYQEHVGWHLVAIEH